MPRADRITITLPHVLVEAIDQVDPNRSGFLARAARRELRRLERKALLRSLDQRAEDAAAAALEQAGFSEWAAQLSGADHATVIEEAGFEPVRWVPGEGWIKR